MQTGETVARVRANDVAASMTINPLEQQAISANDAGASRPSVLVHQPNSFTGTVPNIPNPFVRYSVIDINGDGLKDIVLHFKAGPGSSSPWPAVHEAQNALAIYINVGGQRFEDRTATYLTGPTNIGGLAADQIVLDLNGDGRDDIVYATNQEDSRASDDWADYYGPLSILLSGTNGYTIVQSSAQTWWHGISSGVMSGQAFLTPSGSPSSSQGTAYIFQNGNLVEAGFHYPQGYGNPPGFFSAPSQTDTNYLIQENRLLGFGVMQGWVPDGSGNWQSVGTIDVVGSQPFVKTVQFMPWNGASTRTVNVYLVNGKYVMKELGGLDIVGNMSLSPGSPEIVVFKEYERYIPNFDPASNAVVTEAQTAVLEALRGFTIQNNQLVAVDLHIQGEITAVDFEMSDILDVNGDGYHDLVVRPYNQTGVPLVYLNDTHGGFFNINLTVSNPFDYGRADAASSIVADFNNDGIMDVVTVPANGVGQSMDNFRLYLGHLKHRAHNDFNGDGRSDILLRDQASGWLTNWLGTADGGLVNNNSNAATLFSLDWTVAGTGDFNGDGRVDFLLRQDLGQLTQWLGTSSGGFVDNGPTASIYFDIDWQIVGTGDFNGDGRDDFLLQNGQGWTTNWLGTSNGSFVNNGANTSLLFAPEWKFEGFGDFNGDGMTDFLLRSSTGGWLTEWLGTPNGSFTNNGPTAGLYFTADWKVAGIGDFNGDGISDFLLRQDGGQITQYLGTANGSFTNNGPTATVYFPNEWQIVGLSDVNGDAIDDLVIRNTQGWVTDWLGTPNGSFVNNGSHLSALFGPTYVIQDPFL